MSVLVAGGAGFIGSHLVDALLIDGHMVTAVDNLSLGTRENLQHIEGNANFTFIESELCDLVTLKDIFAVHKPCYVFHLAANSDIKAGGNNPAIEYRNTYTTTFNLLECMRTYDVKNFFFSSTSAVYGEKPGVLLSEDTVNMEPISYYGAAKMGSEALISAYTYMNDLHCLIFRFPNVIGTRLTHGVIYDFIKKLRENPNHLQILGDGKQSKPYMYISDLINGIIKLKNVPQGVSSYNIGVNTQTTVTKIADIITAQMGLTGIPYMYTGGREGWKGDVPSFNYDLTKIHKTGWKASLTSDEAVIKTVTEVLSCEL
jgi:UDP-glucose 4-epimerase